MTKSNDLFSETEIFGQLLDKETHSIIYDRYNFVSNYIKQKDVLEIGSGSGIGLNYFKQFCNSITVLEYSVENFQKLIKNFPEIEIYNGDAHKTEYKDNKFDVIVCLAMIYYLNLEKFLVECNRILRKDGILVFCTSNKDVPGFCSAPFTTNYYSIPEINRILVSYGFNVKLYGAFSTKGSLVKQKVKSYLKNFLKQCFTFIPFGEKIWYLSRIYSRGERVPLSKDLLFSKLKPQIRESLAVDKINENYRVIYVVAHK